MNYGGKNTRSQSDSFHLDMLSSARSRTCARDIQFVRCMVRHSALAHCFLLSPLSKNKMLASILVVSEGLSRLKEICVLGFRGFPLVVHKSGVATPVGRFV